MAFLFLGAVGCIVYFPILESWTPAKLLRKPCFVGRLERKNALVTLIDVCFSDIVFVIMGVSECTMTEVCFLSNVTTDII